MIRPTRPLITVIIPTRERAETLRFTLETAVDQTNNDYEVIISDNYSQDNTEEIVRSFSDPRVRYFKTGQRLSMSDNWEFALEQAAGEYVIFIGDDDAVLPGALDRLQTLVRANPRQVYSWPLHAYNWPIDGQPAFVAHLSPAASQTEINLKKLAGFVISMGGWKYYELPSVYHSAIPKRVLDAIREKTGRVFHSTQPDIFTSMAIPAFASRALRLGYSVTLHGRSAKSNGGASLAKNGKANVERYIGEFGDYQVHPTLYPEAPNLAKLIPDSVLVAMDQFPEFYGQMKFNYDAMWAFVCRLKLMSRQEILRKRSEIRQYHPFNTARFLFYLALHDAAALRRNVLNKCMKLEDLSGRPPDNIRDFAKLLAN